MKIKREKSFIIHFPFSLILLLFIAFFILFFSYNGDSNNSIRNNESTSNTNNTWKKIFNRSAYDCANCIQQTIDGEFIVVGSTASINGDYDIYLIKLGSNGDVIWEKAYGGSNYELGNSIQQTNNGEYIIAGYIGSSLESRRESSDFDFYIIKVDNIGNIVWEKIYGKNDNKDIGQSIQETSDGGYIVTGYTVSSDNGDHDIYILKLDSNGNKVWDKIYGGNDDDRAYSIQHTSDDEYILAGSTSEYRTRNIIVGNGEIKPVRLPPTYSDIYMIKVDNSGNKIFEKNYDENIFDFAYSIHSTSDGGYIIAGRTSDSDYNNSDFYIIKTDLNGIIQNIQDTISFQTSNGCFIYNISTCYPIN